MDSSGSDQPNSICHIQSIHMYTLQHPDPPKPPPFSLLVGEMIINSGNSVDGTIVVTNYRLYLENGENQYHIPLGLIETIEIRELFYLQLFCKDVRTYRCTFENNEHALEWYDKISKAANTPRQIEQLFAFYHCVWTKEKGGEEAALRIASQRKYSFDKDMFENEMTRMQFQGDSWRITKANENYKVCPTYPPYLLVPSCINDEMLESVAKFRSSRRIPVAVWRHTRNGAIIARCSQPEVGWFGWRSSDDEDLLKAISEACNFDRNLRGRTSSTSDKESTLSHSPGSLHSDESLQITGEVVQQEKKLLIMDARSYTTAVANRARGGGCECPEYYPNCEIQFMNLANIHSIRKSSHALRQLCMSSAEQPNWFSLLEGTRWLIHMSGLIKAAVILATAVERDARPVLVHCSDGWDRTPQIVALAELLLDPYYRTVDGFRVLIEREWLAFGHKFADRCGHSGGSEDLNERCPVFLQWLDCVHQLITQFPVSFEFSHNYLIKLAQHTYSNLFGTFLCNTQKQRSKVVYGRTFTVWEFLNGSCFRNHLYTPPQSTVSAPRVLWPKTNVRDLRLWSEVYLGSMEVNFNPEEEGSGGACPGPPEINGHVMSKTRSYGDLMSADGCQASYCGRRSSDPNINRDLKLALQDRPPNSPNAKNHHKPTTHPGPEFISDFVPSDLEDNPPECDRDFIFRFSPPNNSANLTDDQIDGLSFDREESPELSRPDDKTTNGLEGIFLGDDCESDKESVKTEKESAEANNNSPCNRSDSSDNNSISRELEMKLCKMDDQMERLRGLERSVETSTETLVSDQQFVGSLPNDFEKVQRPVDTVDSTEEHCKTCSQGVNTVNSNCRYQSSDSSSSINGWPKYLYSHTRNSKYKGRISNCHLGDDGLIPVRSLVQERLDQIIEEHRRKVEQLEKELHASRQILIKQACHRCQNGDGERHDDNGSLAESLNSVSEGHGSTGESLRSDMSWVDVEEGVLADCQGTLWVPDHAVSRCTGCGTEFWLGRRRHHCRKCGRIFCADCSEHATPLPSEQLYNPVRVCTGCYTELKRPAPFGMESSCSQPIPERCRRGDGQQTSTSRIHTQISASSN
ncbi:myotubularin-related protein 4 isoform X2 [Anthonomus grandis grandis]|nr:myotubularin-related protein 4 isoform X2 [Anthonomus grandis grandis]